MKLLVTGCRGQLDRQVINILKEETSELGPISEEYRIAKIMGVSKEEFDISNLESVKSFMLY